MRSSMASMFLLKATRKVDRCERAFAYLTQKQEKQEKIRASCRTFTCATWKNNVEGGLCCSAQTHVPR